MESVKLQKIAPYCYYRRLAIGIVQIPCFLEQCFHYLVISPQMTSGGSYECQQSMVPIYLDQMDTDFLLKKYEKEN